MENPCIRIGVTLTCRHTYWYYIFYPQRSNLRVLFSFLPQDPQFEGWAVRPQKLMPELSCIAELILYPPVWIKNIARNHAHAEIAHLLTRCIKAWETPGRRLSTSQVLLIQLSRKMCDFCTGMGSCFVPWRVRNIKAAMQISHISAYPFSAWIVSWSWDNTVYQLIRWARYEDERVELYGDQNRVCRGWNLLCFSKLQTTQVMWNLG